MRWFLIPVLALAGCFGNDERPAVKVETVERVVEVQKPCPATEPVEPAPLGELPSNANALIATLAAKLAEYTAPGKYVDQVRAYVRACPAG